MMTSKVFFGHRGAFRGRMVSWLALAVALLFLAAPLVGEAQQARQLQTVGLLTHTRGSPASWAYLTVFRESLRKLGYIEGKNIAFVYRWSEGRSERLPELAAELVGRKVDVLVAQDTATIRVVRAATRTIPIVVLSAGDPVDAGFVESLARPGGNITGVSGRVEVLNEKLLALLKETSPAVSRVAILGTPTSIERYRAAMEAAARSLRVRLQFLTVTSSQELGAAFDAAAKARAGGLVLVPAVLLAANQGRIADLSLERRLPAIFWQSQFPEVGGLMSYGPDLAHLWQRAGVLVGKILKGADPADLPVEQADRYRLVLNLKTAKALGLSIPPSILLRADQVIE